MLTQSLVALASAAVLAQAAPNLQPRVTGSGWHYGVVSYYLVRVVLNHMGRFGLALMSQYLSRPIALASPSQRTEFTLPYRR